MGFAMTSEERAGMWIFQSKAMCWKCHNGFNFSDEKFHNTKTATAEDRGRGDVTLATRDDGAFKTPTLRAISETAPYFHDGSRATLLDVMDHYMNAPLDGEQSDDAEFRPIALSAEEIADIIAFLEQL